MDRGAQAEHFRFDDYRLDLSARVLFRSDSSGVWRPVPIGSRAFAILCVLVERHGTFVSKQDIMAAVWPNTAVEENNLTVQMTALRRVLDKGRGEESCIETMPGRGYRFARHVIECAAWSEPAIDPREGGQPTASSDTVVSQPANASTFVPRPSSLLARTVIACLGVVVLLALLALYSGSPTIIAAAPPRLSMAVMPFQNLSGNQAENYLAEGITDDLTSDLGHLPGAFVISNASARAYGHHSADAKQVGRELGVRYIVEGSVTPAGSTIRMNVQLISAETGVQLWSDRFDEQVANLSQGQEQVLARMRDGLGISLVQIEAARGLRERPINPDAFDLILRANSLRNQPFTARQGKTVLALYEQALKLAPDSILALAGTGQMLMIEQMGNGYWESFEARERVEDLLNQANAIAPMSEAVLTLSALWLRAEDRCPGAMAAARQLIDMFPNNKNGYYILGWCKAATGHADEEIPLLETEARLNPRDPSLFLNIRRMGYDLMLLSRDREAAEKLQQSLAINPNAPAVFRHSTYRMLAAVYARSGQIVLALQAAAEASQLWPFDTVRGHFPEDPTSTILAEQVRHYQEGLRLSGERDHAEESADFGVKPDARLHSEREGYTPTTAPGATTISTEELMTLIREQEPLIVDTLTYSWGRSLPGAVGLRDAGLGGSFNDRAQQRLEQKMRELTRGDLSKPVVAVGWNSERFDGRNLALRLGALGYTRIHWYRGGREAWEVHGLPEANIVESDW